MLCLQELVPPSDHAGTTAVVGSRLTAGGVSVRPFPLPPGMTVSDNNAEVTIGCTPLGFSLGSLERFLRSPAHLCDFESLCQVCPAIRRIPNLGWPAICQEHIDRLYHPRLH